MTNDFYKQFNTYFFVSLLCSNSINKQENIFIWSASECLNIIYQLPSTCKLHESCDVHTLGGSHKAPGSCLHLHLLEGVAFSSSSICQDVPCPPVDTVSHPTVAPTVISSIQVSCQAGIKPPACTIVLTAVPSCVTVVVSVSGAERSAIMIITFAVAQCIACITRVFPRCQTIPGRNNM